MHRTVSSLLGLVAAAALAAPALDLAQENKAGGPLTLTPRPSSVLAGQPVSLEGQASVKPGSPLGVKLTVKPPSGGAKELVARTDGKGHYALAYTPAGPGEYAVTARSADGKTETKARFRALVPSAAAEAATTQLQAAFALASEVEKQVKEQLDDLPPSPQQQTARQKLEAVARTLQDGKALVTQMGPHLQNLTRLSGADPKLDGMMAPALAQLASWADEAPGKLEDWRQLMNRKRQAPTVCDMMDTGNEGLSLLSTVTNFIGGPITIFKNVFIDKVVPYVIGKGADWAASNAKAGASASDLGKTSVSESAKALWNLQGGVTSFLSGGPGIIADCAQYYVRQLQAAYCEQFEGPVSAAFDARFMANGSTYWTYGVTLKGRMFLRYPKKAAAGKNEWDVTGRIEGNAVKFDFWEDVRHVYNPPGLFLLLNQTFKAVPFVDSVNNDKLGFGMFARMATPAYFNVPIEGTVKGKKLAIKLLPAVVDFNDTLVKNRALVIFSEPSVPIPLFRTFDFPIQKAQFILEKGMRMPAEFDLKVSKDATSFERDFTRDWKADANDITIKWKIHVEASNPPL